MREERADHLPPGLEHAVRLLREDEPITAAWRDRVLDAVSADDESRRVEHSHRRVVPLRAAIAAAVVCAIAGSAVTVGVLRRVSPRASVAATSRASAPATILLPVHFSLVAAPTRSRKAASQFDNVSKSFFAL